MPAWLSMSLTKQIADDNIRTPTSGWSQGMNLQSFGEFSEVWECLNLPRFVEWRRVLPEPSEGRRGTGMHMRTRLLDDGWT
jgi:hypothetical protein